MRAGRFRLQAGERAIDVEVSADGTASAGDLRAAIRPDGDGALVVEIDGRRRPAFVAGDDDERWVWIDGRVFVFEVGAAGRPRAARSAEGGLAAPMPATVSRIVAGVGEEVEAGDVILVLEAMKMELPLRAPRAGRVAAIHCREGELVQPGPPLVDLS